MLKQFQFKRGKNYGSKSARNRFLLSIFENDFMKELLNILRYKRVALNIGLALVTLVLVKYFVFAVPLLFILLSNLYDILGYHFILIRKQNYLPEIEFVKSYRIIQLMFDITLLLLLGVSFGWVPSLCGGLLKVFGVQDLLYYVFLNKPFPKIWTWLKWTPLGFFKRKLILPEVVIQAVAGIILSALFLLHHFKIV